MPEARELEFQYLQADGFLQTEKSKPGWDPRLRNIFVDITKDERNTTGSQRLKRGFIDSLACAMDIKRGSKSIQKPVFPHQMFNSFEDLLDAKLELTGIEHTGRSIVLVFGDLLCQPLTHTNIQIYDAANWEAVYRTSHLPLIGKHPESKMRTFKCALAFQVGDHVISFNTLDFLFQVTWAWARERNDPVKGLAHRDFSVLDQWPEFVSLWATLIQETVTKKTKSKGLTGSLRNWLTDPKNTMYNPGVGAYSVAEVMHLAGLPTDISLGDLLRSPSRVCRYLLALYQFLFVARYRIWVELVRACIHNNILAPRSSQRLKYADYLHVWAKDVCYTTIRHYDAVNTYNLAKKDKNLENLDAFEPTLLKDAIRHAPELVPVLFGHLEGCKLFDNELDGTETWIDNPLLAAFRSMSEAKLIVPSKACLRENDFVTLFLPSSEMRKRMLSTKLYAVAKDKIWTVFVCKHRANFKLVVGLERTKRIFRLEVLGTKDVAIGPLEYCGVGMIVRRKSGKGF
ncbi:unnamed protein product [Peniophora sp. CBMAI 1063]|nr:unnamed protein product [Peniophora sp. CBMAI 1063]